MITKIYRKSYLLIGAALFAFQFSLFTSCEKNVNDWEVDESYARLFTPLAISVVDQTATSVQIQYQGVNDAEQYVFEMSENGNQDFTTISRTEVVKADTLKAFVEGNTPAKTKYRILFEDLNGQQSYSVRMKGVNQKKQLESHYISTAFTTLAEQIFEKTLSRVDGATLFWDASKKVTTLQIGQLTDNAEGTQDTTWIDKFNVSDVTNGTYVLTNLTPGTNYVAKIWNQQVLRGMTTFKTLGSPGGTIIHVLPNDNVSMLLLQTTDTDVSLTFEPGQTYELGYITIPSSIKKLYFIGAVDNGTLPLLHLSKITLNAQLTELEFSNVDIDNQETSTYLFQLNTRWGIDRLTFDNSTVRNIRNSLLQVSNPEVKIGTTTINNCLLNNIGSVDNGLIYVSSAASFQTLAITNTTMVNMGKQIVDIRSAVDSISVNHVTFYNGKDVKKPVDQFFRFADKIKPKVKVENSILAGPNGGRTMSSGYDSYSFVSFPKTYITSDLREGKYPFAKAVFLELTSEELFVDPEHGDFHIRPDAVFEARGKAGDPRWSDEKK